VCFVGVFTFPPEPLSVKLFYVSPIQSKPGMGEGLGGWVVEMIH
jgi:hypothetical protein